MTDYKTPISKPRGSVQEDAEHCCKCRTPTLYWTKIKDRKPGEQVALCPTCASHHEPSQLPSKKEWCDAEESLRGGTFIRPKPTRPKQ